MSASMVPIELKRGNMIRLNPVTIDGKDGKLIDLTGYEVRWCLYRDLANTPFLTKSSKDADTENGVLITNVAEATIRITISSEDTEDLPQGRYYHEIQIVDAQQQVSTVAYGTLILLNKL